MTALQGYEAVFREKYVFEQEHRPFGGCNLFRIPRRPAGLFTEPAVAGPSLQINLRPQPSAARVDLGVGRFDIPLSHPKFVVSPAGVPCVYDTPRELDLLIVEFSRSTLDDLTSGAGEDLGRLHAKPHDDALVVAAALRMWALRGSVTALEAETQPAALAILLLRSMHDKPPAPVIRGGLSPWQVRRVVECLEASLADDISLAALAQLVGLSPNHFCTAFRVSLGEPPHRYLIRRRVERA